VLPQVPAVEEGVGALHGGCGAQQRSGLLTLRPRLGGWGDPDQIHPTGAEQRDRRRRCTRRPAAPRVGQQPRGGR
jgi:hypothetical protein